MSRKYTTTGDLRTRVSTSRRTRRHKGCESPTGRFQSLHDIRCLAAMGCDLKKMIDLRTGVPTTAQKGTS